MTDPANPFDRLGMRTPIEERRRAEQLTRRIDDEELVSPWVWPQLLDTVRQLSALPDDLAWVATAYLSAVIVKGDRMFSAAAQQMHLHPTSTVSRTLRCPCGTDTPAGQPVTRNRREVVTAVCQACRATIVEFDGEPYPGPTLVSNGGVH